MPTIDDSNKGRILTIRHNLDGYHRVTLDNGPTSVIHVVTPSEALGPLLAADSRTIHKLLARPEPGARNKRKKGRATRHGSTNGRRIKTITDRTAGH